MNAAMVPMHNNHNNNKHNKQQLNQFRESKKLIIFNARNVLH